jgi:pyrroline-5-carboxylate reductase
MREEVTCEVNQKLAFIGTGKIAEVWMDRMIMRDLVIPTDVMACDVRPERLAQIQSEFRGVHTSADNREAARFARVLVLATPPGEVLKVLAQIKNELSAEHLLVCLAAGVPLAKLQEVANIPVVRVMPNTPALVGEAMNLVAYGNSVSSSQRAFLETLLEKLGDWYEVDDGLMEYWCALCAVGPTYLFPVVEALSSAATARGIPAEQALDASAQLLIGVGKLIQESEKSVAELQQMISLHTLREEEAKKLFTDAYNDAVAKLEGLARRMAA